MTRALGFLTGVCLTVVAFMLVLDRWQLQERTEDASADVVIDTAVTAPIVEPSDPTANITDDSRRSETDTTNGDLESAAADVDDGTIEKYSDLQQTTTTANPAQQQANGSAAGTTAQAHVFWSPFRSEWAAKGFARRLSNATQIPIAIVKAGSEQYRVSFDYRDESERLEHVERIESITGLQLE